MPTRAIDVHGRRVDCTYFGYSRVIEVERWSRNDHSLFWGVAVVNLGKNKR